VAGIMEYWNDGILAFKVVFHFKFLAKMIFNTKIPSPPFSQNPLFQYSIPMAQRGCETFEKCQFLFKFKKGDIFNHRNTLTISMIKI
jgi:hypothetical protein